MQECRLSAEDLSCSRGERLLFAGLSLALGAGDSCHVTGPNGIGKSSLLRILAGLSRPLGGTVTRVGAAGLIDENAALDPAQPLGKALSWWARLDGPANDHVARLGLADLLDVPVRYLSTGQKKRAACARLMAQDAPIWFLDEPLNGLDRDGAALIEDIASRHCRAGGIAFIASHQPFALAGMQRVDLTEYQP